MISKVYAAILCGGLGKRLRNIAKNIPKPMVDIDGRPFLDILISYITSFGVKNIVLLTGFKSEVIENYYRNKKLTISLHISKEEKLLGTGGAIKFAERYIKSNPFFVLNGDSLCRVDLRKLLEFHIRKKADATIVLTNAVGMSDTKDYGSVEIDKSQRVISFSEKSKSKRKFINAGVYVFNKKILKLIPENREFSLENDLFSRIKNFYGYSTKEVLLDIGTPERYQKAQFLLSRGTKDHYEKN